MPTITPKQKGGRHLVGIHKGEEAIDYYVCNITSAITAVAELADCIECLLTLACPNINYAIHLPSISSSSPWATRLEDNMLQNTFVFN